MFKDLDPILHSQLRLAVMSILIGVKEAEFSYLKEKTGSTAGNLSVQITKLSEAEYITVEKTFRDNYPLTTVKITPKGILAFEGYVKALQGYIKKWISYLVGQRSRVKGHVHVLSQRHLTFNLLVSDKNQTV